MNLEEAILQALAEKPASGGRLIERFQAGQTALVRGRAALVYGALANLQARGEIEVVAAGPGECVWGLPDDAAEPPLQPGLPPSFGLDPAGLRTVDREVGRITKGLLPHYFEELRRVVVADADRRVFHGERLPRAVMRALDDLGPAAAVRRHLRRAVKGGPVALRLPHRRRRWLAVVAAMVFGIVLVRLFVLGVYTIPRDSVSMAPTLTPGVEAEGDRWVLANLLAYLLDGPRRGEIVIFRLPHLPQILVKRVMGLPGETLAIRGEDLFIDGERLVKERALLDRVRVPLFDLDAFERTETGWRQARAVHAGTPAEPRGLCRDVVVRARVRAARGGSATFLLEDRGGGQPHAIVLRPDGGAVSADGIQAARGRALSLRADGPTDVWFTNADGVFRVEVDGREVARAVLARENRPGPRLTVVAEKGADLESLEVARDLVYESVEVDVRIGDDAYFVLGDNSRESRDSRHFKEVPREALLGRVFAVAWPPSRIRRLK